jgi:hypothetical protein
VIGNEARNNHCKSMNHQSAELVRSVDMRMNLFIYYSRIDIYRTNRNTCLSKMNFSTRAYLRGLTMLLNVMPIIGITKCCFSSAVELLISSIGYLMLSFRAVRLPCLQYSSHYIQSRYFGHSGCRFFIT